MVDWTSKPPPKPVNPSFKSSSSPTTTLPKGVEHRTNNYNSNAGWTIGHGLPKTPEKSGPK